MTAAGAPAGSGAWTFLFVSCNPTALPTRPLLGVAQVREAFRRTPFAVPTTALQPPRNVTLVHLRTYATVSFPTAGREPGEVDAVTLLGHAVQIEPVFVSTTCAWGDGATSGRRDTLGVRADPRAHPSTSPPPPGAITHAYARPGQVTVRCDVTYTARYRIDGGPWTDLDDTLAVAGAPTPLRIKEAAARLTL